MCQYPSQLIKTLTFSSGGGQKLSKGVYIIDEEYKPRKNLERDLVATIENHDPVLVFMGKHEDRPFSLHPADWATCRQ